MKEFLDRIEQTLTIPAAEYVPAIGDVFAIIDEARKAIDSQQPVAEVVAGTENFGAVQFSGPIPPKGTKLYTVPPALQEPSEQLREDVKRAREKIGLLYADGVPDFMDRVLNAAIQEVPRQASAACLEAGCAVAARERREVPREPVAVWQSQCKDGTWADCTEANARAGERYGFAARALYASPSTTQQPSVDHALNTTPVVDHATQQQEAGSGWRLVPVEPTQEMLRAGLSVHEFGWCEASEDTTECGVITEAGITQADADAINAESMTQQAEIYRAMLAAAPSTPARENDADGVPASEVERLRAGQAASVMPQIGPLLDAWDGMDNDTKAVLREEAPDLAEALIAIARAMEGADGVPGTFNDQQEKQR